MQYRRRSSSALVANPYLERRIYCPRGSSSQLLNECRFKGAHCKAQTRQYTAGDVLSHSELTCGLQDAPSSSQLLLERSSWPTCVQLQVVNTLQHVRLRSLLRRLSLRSCELALALRRGILHPLPRDPNLLLQCVPTLLWCRSGGVVQRSCTSSSLVHVEIRPSWGRCERRVERHGVVVGELHHAALRRRVE